MKHIINSKTSFLFYCILFIGCNSTEINYPNGGYEYRKNFNNIDTDNYRLPISSIVGTKDSFNFSYYGYYWGRGYNEPNLSLRPLGKTVFRLTYETAFNEGAVFILTEDEIVVKRSNDENLYPRYDSINLSTLERYHYGIFYRNFPLQNPNYSDLRRKRLDSLASLYPKLLDPGYYRYLLDKSAAPKNTPFVYTTQRKKITKRQFYNIVTLINKSGYWKLPFRNKCNEEFLDGFGFTLEANTPKKYNAVDISCPFDKSAFVQACQELINLAELDKPIKVYYK